MQAPTAAPDRSSKTWTRVATLVVIAALLGAVVLALPRGFDTDLTGIGTGKPALVFVYDPNLVVSNQQTQQMDKARETLGDAVHFLVADVGRPDAQRFIEAHQTRPTQLLLFASDGRLLIRMQALASSDQLIRAMEAAARH